jgi:hypothetical protein
MHIRHSENARTLNQSMKPSYQGKHEIVTAAPGLRGLDRFCSPPVAKPKQA